MNKEILKRNIEQVINQPCVSDYPNRIESNGLSEDGKYIYVRIEPKDSYRRFTVSDDLAERILGNMGQNYREHLVTLRHGDWVSYSYEPVFDTDTQAIWDAELRKYLDDKQAWCDKYGCD